MQLVPCQNSSEINGNHQNSVLKVATGMMMSNSMLTVAMGMMMSSW
jgi:hypothetical protein